MRNSAPAKLHDTQESHDSRNRQPMMTMTSMPQAALVQAVWGVLVFAKENESYAIYTRISPGS